MLRSAAQVSQTVLEIGGQEMAELLISMQRNALPMKTAVIKIAIDQSKKVTFSYIDKKYERTVRTIEPQQILIKNGELLVLGWCGLREMYRLFKIRRMTNVEIGETFNRKDIEMIPE